MKFQATPSHSSREPRSTGSKWRSASDPKTLAKKCGSKVAQDVYDSILWRIEAQCQANETMAVGLTGCMKKSGSTTIAANLAVQACAQERGSVLLIDANWKGSSLPKMFGLPHEAGLYDILSGEISPRECEPYSVTDNLDILSCGKWHDDQPSLVQQELVEEMLSEFKSDYRLILVDLPIAEELRSSLPLARQLDGTLLVTRFEAVKQPQAQRALHRLQEDGVTVWGSILNRHREYVPKWLRDRLA